MRKALLAIAAALLASAATSSSTNGDGVDDRLRARVAKLARPAKPRPDPTNRVADDPRAARLGQRLFFDARPSANGKIACATCHDPARAFCDGKSKAVGLAELDRHAPTLLETAASRWYFWDGRADSAWSQALQPIENDAEIGGSRVDLARLVVVDATLRAEYEAVFGSVATLAEALDDVARFPPHAKPLEADSHGELDPRARAWFAMTPDDRRAIDTVFANAGKSIAAYERLLAPRGSPFDRWVAAIASDDAAGVAAYPEDARRGFELFAGKAGCRSCHNGPWFSDDEFHNIGVPTLDRTLPRDPGRYAGIERLKRDPFNAHGAFSDQRDGDRAVELVQLVQSPDTWGTFKTPTLRNVGRTAPYMHQGQLATLRDVVRYYSTLEGSVPLGHHGETVLRPLKLTDREIDDLVAFLESLTDAPLADELLRAP